jgi:hypothetical protein
MMMDIMITVDIMNTVTELSYLFFRITWVA